MAGKDNIIGMAMGLDVTDLKAGINEVKKLVKQSNDEFKLATVGLDKWTQSADGLTAKINQLNKQFDAQKKAVDGYKAEIERVSQLEGDHSIQLEQLRKKLLDAEIAVKKTETQINKYSNSLSQVNAENKKAESSFGKLTREIEEQKAELSELEFAYKDAVLTYGKNSKEAKELEKQIAALNSNLQKNQNEVKEADKALGNLEKQLDDTEEEAKDFGSALDNIKGLGASVVKGVTAVGATIGGLATAFFATAESTRELRTNMGKVETAFTTAGLSAEQATKTYQDLYAVVADEGKATEATAHIAKLAKSQEDLSKWVNISTGVYATFGDSLPIENLAEASNETAKTGAITGGLADALNWAGVSEEAFQEKLDNLSTEQERNQLITETLNGLYGEASLKYQEVNKDVIESNKAQAELSNTMAQLGEKAEPIMTAIRNGFNQILQSVIELLNGADFEGIKNGINNAFQYAIDTIIPAIVNGFTWIMDNKDTLIAGIVAIGTGMLAWNVVSIVQGVVTAIKAWTVATEGMTVAQKLLNLVMNANPIGIVITLITSLVAAFTYLWNTSDEFRAFWINLWEKIKSACSVAIDAIGKFFSNLWENIKQIGGKSVDWFSNIGNKISNGFKTATNNTKTFFSNAWSKVKSSWSNAGNWFKDVGTKISNGMKTATNNTKNFFSNAWNNIKKSWSNAGSWFSGIKDRIVSAFKNIPNNIKTFFTNAWNNVRNAWSNVTGFFTDIKNKIINAFKTLPTNIKNVGKNLVEGLWNGIKDMTSWVQNKIKGFSESILNGIKGFFGIHSPSKVMAQMGNHLAEGMAIGIEQGTDLVLDSASDLAKDTKTEFENGLEFENQGKLLDKELALGIEKEKDGVLDTTKTLAVQTNASLSNNLNGEEIGNLFVQSLAQGITDSKDLAFEAITGVTKEAAEKAVQAQVEALKNQPKTPYSMTTGSLVNFGNGILSREDFNNAVASGVDSQEEMDEYIKNNDVTFVKSTSPTLDEALDQMSKEKFGIGLDELTAAIEESDEYKEAVQLAAENAYEENEEIERLQLALADREADIERLKNLTTIDDETEDESDKKEEKSLKKAAREVKEETKKIKEDLEETPKSFIDKFEEALKISEKDLNQWASGLGGKISKVYSIVEGAGSKIGELGKAAMDAFNAQIDAQVKQLDYELEVFKKSKDAEIEQAEERYEKEIDLLEEQLDDKLITEEDYTKKAKALELSLAETKKKAEDEIRKQEEATLKRKNELAKKQFNAQQKNDIAQALINGAQAILKGFAELGPLGGAINAGAQGLITAAQIKTIKAQKFIPMLAKGGIVDSPTFAMIGEAGKEAVMPLENNTGWINELAFKLNDIMQRDYIGGMKQASVIYHGDTVVNNNYNYQQTINSPSLPSRREIYRDTKNLLALKGV